MKAILLLALQTLFFVSLFAQKNDISIDTDHKELNEIFVWAKQKARSFVVTGKRGPVNIHQKNQESATVSYLPSYWAGYPLRTAFYSRDFCHQAIGAHLLGLEAENFTMLRAFAASATPSRKWFPLWAINFDGTPYTLDYKNDDNFVREIPAVFELVEKNAQLYDWTKDKRYLTDSALRQFNAKAVSDFVLAHDLKNPNGVAESDGSGNIFKGTATYNEHRDQTLIEAGDGIGSQYQAYLAFAKLSELSGNNIQATTYNEKAKALWNYFNKEWGIVDNKELYNRGYDKNNFPVAGWGKENSWFLPLKEITDPRSDRHLKYLNYIDEQLGSKEGLPENIEAITYVPELFFKYGQNERGWKWLKYIISKINTVHAMATLTGNNGDYPEVSFVLISNVVQDMMGVNPGKKGYAIETCSHLPKELGRVKVSNVKIGRGMYTVEQRAVSETILSYTGGEAVQYWQAGFPGSHPYLYCNGKKTKSSIGQKNGITYSYIVVKIIGDRQYSVTTQL
ncbi:hypothetical protein [Sphingobacterium detergens]|uniref:hypothetical protein n=1 Tax=Sphingobacterium detergens TaxID=1145106 RepID=UPI003AAC1BA4